MSQRLLRVLLAAVLATGAAGAVFGQGESLGPDEREALVKLQSAKPDVRRDGIDKLGKLKSRGAVGDLVRVASSDPDPTVRRAALLALGRINDRSRIPDMIAALKDQDAKVRNGAVQGLVNLYLPKEESFFGKVKSTTVRVVPFWDERQTATVEPYDVPDPAVTKAIAELMRADPVEENRVAAVRALGALKARSEIEALADTMAADAKLREEVLDAFVLVGETDAARYARPLFTSPDASLASRAMITAGRLRAADAVDDLLNVYGADAPKTGVIGAVKSAFSPERRKSAFLALALIGDPKAEEAFVANVLDSDADIRRAAYEGLAREGDKRYLPLVQRNGLIEKNDEVRLAQTFALYKYGQNGMFGIIANALRDSSRRDQAAQYVLEADSVEHLMPFIRMPDKTAQRIIVDAMGRLGDDATADALRPIVRGSSPEVAIVADRAIRRIEWRLANTQAPATTATTP
jgi:HEAT repeat protein